MWYLHNHFVCARLLALCAIAAPSFLAISDLNNRYARRKDLICKAKSILHPHSGWFHVSRASRAQQAKALKNQNHSHSGWFYVSRVARSQQAKALKQDGCLQICGQPLIRNFNDPTIKREGLTSMIILPSAAGNAPSMAWAAIFTASLIYINHTCCKYG